MLEEEHTHAVRTSLYAKWKYSCDFLTTNLILVWNLVSEKKKKKKSKL